MAAASGREHVMLTCTAAKAHEREELFTRLCNENGDYVRDSLWKIGLGESAFRLMLRDVT